jgi:hypothetical protein
MMKTLTVSNKTKGGGTITADFVTNDDNAAKVESMDSSVPDTPVVNNNLGQSKYGCTYRRTMHYDPTPGRTIGVEARQLPTITNASKTLMARWNLPTLELV